MNIFFSSFRFKVGSGSTFFSSRIWIRVNKCQILIPDISSLSISPSLTSRLSLFISLTLTLYVLFLLKWMRESITTFLRSFFPSFPPFYIYDAQTETLFLTEIKVLQGAREILQISHLYFFSAELQRALRRLGRTSTSYLSWRT